MMKKFVCTICGYIHEGDSAPEFCPQCKAPASKFEEMKETAVVYADEHRIVSPKIATPVLLRDCAPTSPVSAPRSACTLQ